MIKQMDFATIVSAKKVKDSGLNLGEEVFVVGTKYVPASSKDEYLQRMLVTVVRMVDDLPAIPKENNDYIAYLVDPRSLEKVNEDRQKELSNKVSEKYQGL